MMSIFLLLTGFAFWIENDTARIAVVALGIYCELHLFCFASEVATFSDL